MKTTKTFLLPLLVLLFLAPMLSAQTGNNVPEWAQHAVWYQLFPERFHNADPSNDPTPERINAPEGWEISPWAGDWYQRAAWEQRQGSRFRDFVFDRRYGGDLQGVIDKLDYLSDLGITAIYFNPVFDAVSLHKYDASHYHHIDRHFGPDPAGDLAIMEQEDPGDPSTWQWTSADRLFLELIEKAHEKGIRIVVDGVWNHTGRDFWAFRDIQQNGQESRYKDWYSITEWNEALPDGFDYEGWWGYKGLPEFREVDGNLYEPVKQHIFDVTRRWMDPYGNGDLSKGVDGWRLDVAEEVGHAFWREWHALVRSINPEALTIAEIWGDAAREYVTDDQFDVVMNYRFATAAHAFFLRETLRVSEFDERLAALRNEFPVSVNHAMQNLMDSHDTERLASMVVNRSRDYKEGSKIERIEHDYDVRKPNEEEWKRMKLLSVFQFTYVGAPMIYYGTEAGMWGADDPDDRKPMTWPGAEHDDEVNHPFSRERPRDAVGFDEGMHAWYTRLAAIRNAHEALRTGDFRTVYANDEAGVYGFVRTAASGDMALILLNRGEVNHTAEMDLSFMRNVPRRLTDQISGTTVTRTGRNSFRVVVPSTMGMVLTR